MDKQGIRKTFKYKLKPTQEQEQALAFVVRRCRELYNAALQERREAWRTCCVNITEASQSAQLPAIKEVRPEYHDIHSQVLQEVLTRLERAFHAFFRRVKNGETPSYPRFQGSSRYNSFTCKQFGNSAALDNGFLVPWKIGRIAVRWSRPLEGVPKTVTISREVDGWSVCCSCADVPVQALPATLSDGTRIFHPGRYRKAERALKTAHRRVSRRKKGSKRRRKAVKLLAKAHQKVRRQRADFHHKTALALERANDTIYHEDVQVRTMLRNHHLAKSSSDAGWSACLTMLPYKAAYAGRRVVALDPAFTSQMCSGCGVLVSKGLSVRWHSCPACGTSLRRDQNAAKNRERLGQSRRGGAALAASESRASPGFGWGSVNLSGLPGRASVVASTRRNWLVRAYPGEKPLGFSLCGVSHTPLPEWLTCQVRHTQQSLKGPHDLAA
jgi:putative transposase